MLQKLKEIQNIPNYTPHVWTLVTLCPMGSIVLFFLFFFDFLELLYFFFCEFWFSQVFFDFIYGALSKESQNIVFVYCFFCIFHVFFWISLILLTCILKKRAFRVWSYVVQFTVNSSSTAQSGGGSFKNRKPIGEVGCSESGMAERSHCWSERWLISLTISLSFSDYLPTYPPTYLSIYLCIYRSIYLPIFLSNYLSIYLPICLSIYLSISLSHICLSVQLSTCLSVYLSIYLSVCLSICLPVYLRCSVIQCNVV